MQYSLSKHPDLPNVPLVMDLAKSDEERAMLKLIFGRQVMGRPFVAPPGVRKDRIDALRDAFLETMADTEFVAEAERGKIEIMQVSGEDVEKLVLDVYRHTAPDLAARAGAAIN